MVDVSNQPASPNHDRRVVVVRRRVCLRVLRDVLRQSPSFGVDPGSKPRVPLSPSSSKHEKVCLGIDMHRIVDVVGRTIRRTRCMHTVWPNEGGVSATRVLVARVPWRNIGRGDTVAWRLNASSPGGVAIDRVIAMPGEVLSVHDGTTIAVSGDSVSHVEPILGARGLRGSSRSPWINVSLGLSLRPSPGGQRVPILSWPSPCFSQGTHAFDRTRSSVM